MEPVRVPQNLELRDVLVWGLGAVDLAWVAACGAVAWWVYVSAPLPNGVRLGLAVPLGLVGLALGAGNFQGRMVREWLLVIGRFAIRPRRLLYRGGEA